MQTISRGRAPLATRIGLVFLVLAMIAVAGTLASCGGGDDDTPPPPTVIRADFDGNGIADYAVLVRELASPNPDEVFAVLMGHGRGRYSAAMKAFFGGLLGNVYLGYIAPGETLTPTAGSSRGGTTVRLDRPGVRLIYHRRAADAFYWDEISARFDSVPLGR